MADENEKPEIDLEAMAAEQAQARQNALNMAIRNGITILTSLANTVGGLLGAPPSKIILTLVHGSLDALVQTARSALIASQAPHGLQADADKAKELCDSLGEYLGVRRSGLVVVPGGARVNGKSIAKG